MSVSKPATPSWAEEEEEALPGVQCSAAVQGRYLKAVTCTDIPVKAWLGVKYSEITICVLKIVKLA